jgi:hypothetical protein
MKSLFIPILALAALANAAAIDKYVTCPKSTSLETANNFSLLLLLLTFAQTDNMPHTHHQP